MPKGTPATGKRAQGGGRKPLPAHQLKKRLVLYVTDDEREKVKEFILTLDEGRNRRRQQQKETGQ